MNRLAALTLGLILAMAAPVGAQDTPAAVVAGPVPFVQRVLVSGLQAPWEVTWGPDGMLWVTERAAGRVVRIHPVTGALRPAITLTEVAAPGWQDGLLGLALHPGLLTGSSTDHVFVAYTYQDAARPPVAKVTDPASPYRQMHARIVRLTWDPATETLADPVTLIEGLPAGADHNSGRLKIGPDGALYYTIGDQGNNQLASFCTPIEAQRLPTEAEVAAGDFTAYQGKSLRIAPDGTIPADNPTLGGVQSHIFTYGHRNMQGIGFGPDGTLYASEQGPKSDDEVNILLPGGNYGWPHVVGFRDDQAYQHARWAEATTPCASLNFSDRAIHPSVPRSDETSWTGAMQSPLATLFTVLGDWNFSDPACNGTDFICWPTVAASSIEPYRPAQGGIPGFGNALLVTSLKRGSLYRVPLSPDGQSAGGPIERYFQTENRYRDLAISPDQRSIFIATDLAGLTTRIAGGVTDRLQDPGAILVFTYTGP